MYERAMYERALFALSRSLSASSTSLAHLERLCELCPVLPLDVNYDPVDTELPAGACPRDSRSKSALLALASLLDSPWSPHIFLFMLPYVHAIRSFDASDSSFATMLLRCLLDANLNDQATFSLSEAIASCLSQLIDRADNDAVALGSSNSFLSFHPYPHHQIEQIDSLSHHSHYSSPSRFTPCDILLLVLASAVSSALGSGSPPSTLLLDPLRRCLRLSSTRLCDINESLLSASDPAVKRKCRRLSVKWAVFQANTVLALALQVSDSAMSVADQPWLFRMALHELGFSNSSLPDLSSLLPDTDEMLGSRPRLHLSYGMLQACLLLMVRCANVNPALVAVVLFCQVRLLKSSLRPSNDKHRKNISNCAANVAGSVKIFGAVLSAMRQLVTAHISFTGTAITELRNLLCSDDFENNSDRDELHELISEAMALMLREELDVDGRSFSDTVARKLVFSLDNSLIRVSQKTPTSSASPQEREQSTLLLLGRLTAMVNHSKVTEHVLPLLVNRFANSPKLLHIVIPHMTDIALVSEPRIFKSIVLLLTNIYSKPFIADNKYNRKEIPDALLRLAMNLENQSLRTDLLKSLLKLFKLLARQIQERVNAVVPTNSSSMAGVLGLLLPTIAVLMQPSFDGPSGDYGSNTTATESPWGLSRLTQQLQVPSPLRIYEQLDKDIKWFRSIWYYLVLYQLTERNEALWPPAWYECVRLIAARTPCLVSSSSAQGAEFEASFGSSADRLAHSTTAAAELRARLSQLFPSRWSLISTLPLGSVMYVLAVHALETLRVSWGSFKYVFAYLEYDTSSTLSKLVEDVADAVFESYMRLTRAWSPESSRRLNIESHTIFLLLKCCSRYERICVKARDYLRQLVTCFPFLQWCNPCISGLLDLIQVVHGASSGLDACVPARIHNVTLQGITFSLDLPEQMCHRQSMLASLQKIATRWLENSSFQVPAQILSLLQLYIHDVQQRNPSPTAVHDHVGIALALGVVVSTKKITRLDLSLKTRAGFANFASSPLLSSLCMRQRYLGEIRGHFLSFMRLNANSTDSTLFFGEFQSQQLLNDFQSIMARYRRVRRDAPIDEHDEGSEIQKEFERCMFMAAALLVWSLSDEKMREPRHQVVDPRELMHLLCMAPVHVFGIETMQTAVLAWGWLFTVSHSLAIGVLVTMKSAWAYTVEHGLGLFAGGSSSKRTEAQFDGCLFTRAGEKICSDASRDATPHDLWIEFLLERFDTLRDRSLGALRVVEAMLHMALSRPERLSSGAGTFGPRFRLLFLGQRMVQYAWEQLQRRVVLREDLELLRDRVYAAAFAWFLEAPRWSVNHTLAKVEQEASTIVAFIQALNAEATLSGAYYGDVSTSANFSTNNAESTALPNTTAASVVSVPSTLKSSVFLSAGGKSAACRSYRASAHDPAWVHARSSAQLSVSQRQTRLAAPVRSFDAWLSAPHVLPDAMATANAPSSSASSKAPTKAAVPPPSKASEAVAAAAVAAAEGVGLRSLKEHRQLLVVLLSHEYQRLVAWHNPRRVTNIQLCDEKLYASGQTVVTANEWIELFETAWSIDPRLCLRLAQRFSGAGVLRQLLRARIVQTPQPFYPLAAAVQFLATPKNVRKDVDALKHLVYFESCSLPMALRMLQRPYCENRVVTEYVMRSLRRHAHDGVIFFMAEILQALRYDTFGLLRRFLLDAGTASPHLAHQLIWACQTESVVDEGARRGSGLKASDDPLPLICRRLEHEVVCNFNAADKKFFDAEFGFFEEVTKLSVELLAIPKAQKEARTAQLRRHLERIRNEVLRASASTNLYLPTDHTSIVRDLNPHTAIPLQSSTRVPFLVEFAVVRKLDADAASSAAATVGPGLGSSRRVSQCSDIQECGTADVSIEEIDEDEDDEDEDDDFDGDKQVEKEVASSATTSGVWQKVIFKAGDDCRQDALALQYIRLAKDILADVGLPLFLYPYMVVPNRTGIDHDLGGVIEVVPNTRSRDDLGKSNGLSLREYFISKYGRVDCARYKCAQRNFVLSMAGYAIVCYLLQVKDRHNGNILIDEDGHLVHIDFGFIFDISPASNLRFESAGFKLTVEMVEVMGEYGSEMWKWFVELCARGYLALREHRDDFIALAELMMDSALGCFKSDSVRNLHQRFAPEKNERDAAQHMVAVVLDSYNKLTTGAYDLIQYRTEGIYYYAGPVE